MGTNKITKKNNELYGKNEKLYCVIEKCEQMLDSLFNQNNFESDQEMNSRSTNENDSTHDLIKENCKLVVQVKKLKRLYYDDQKEIKKLSDMLESYHMLESVHKSLTSQREEKDATKKEFQEICQNISGKIKHTIDTFDNKE